jgi:hypothetical protein
MNLTLRKPVKILAVVVLTGISQLARATDVCLESPFKQIIDFVVISNPKLPRLGQVVPFTGIIVYAVPSHVEAPFTGSAVGTPTGTRISVLGFEYVTGLTTGVALSWQATDGTLQGNGTYFFTQLFDPGSALDLVLTSTSCSNVPMPT